MAALPRVTLDAIVRGDDKLLLITAVDGEGQPLNLTDKILWCTAKLEFDSDEDDVSDNTIFTKTTDNGIAPRTQTGSDIGKAEVSIDSADTIGLPAERVTLKMDVQYFESGVGIKTIWQGTLPVTPDVTVRTTLP